MLPYLPSIDTLGYLDIEITEGTLKVVNPPKFVRWFEGLKIKAPPLEPSFKSFHMKFHQV